MKTTQITTSNILTILKSGTILPSSTTGNDYVSSGLKYAAQMISEYDNINVVCDDGITFLSFSTNQTMHNGHAHVPCASGHIRIQSITRTGS